VRSQQFPGAPLTALAALKGNFADPADFVTELASATIQNRPWPQPKKDDVQQWLEASLAWLQELIRIRQRVAQQRLHYPQLTQVAEQWLQREQIYVTICAKLHVNSPA
jgi:DNA polymerase-3 subunit delta'